MFSKYIYSLKYHRNYRSVKCRKNTRNFDTSTATIDKARSIFIAISLRNDLTFSAQQMSSSFNREKKFQARRTSEIHDPIYCVSNGYP